MLQFRQVLISISIYPFFSFCFVPFMHGFIKVVSLTTRFIVVFNLVLLYILFKVQ